MTNEKINQARPSKGYIGMAMEGPIAAWYAKNTRQDSDRGRVVRELIETIPAGSRVLEVAPGPGYVTIELAKTGRYILTGLDISKSFVEMAQANAREAGVAVDFRLGNVSSMPFQSDTFDFIYCRAAFKNFSEPVRALQEMQRVLKPNGRALIHDLRRDATMAEINENIRGFDMSPINAWFTRLVFKTSLLKRAYTKQEVLDMATQAGIHKYEVKENGIGLEIFLEK